MNPGVANLSPTRQAWRRFRARRRSLLAAAWLGGVLALGLLWPVFSQPVGRRVLPAALTWAPNEFAGEPFQAPTLRHWMGTDVHGRDLLSRALHGGRLSLIVGLLGAGVSLVIGVLWGGVAGYLGGRWDSALMRVVDALYALPTLVLVLVLIGVVEPAAQGWMRQHISPAAEGATRMVLVFVGIGAVSWLTMARMVRAQVRSLCVLPFVEASRALGAGSARILFRHLLPNTYGVIIVYLTLTIPSVILYESFLSYLGLGIQPPQASLGSLIAEGAASLNAFRSYWWLLVFPGGLLASTLLALNLVGDGLREAADPRGESR